MKKHIVIFDLDQTVVNSLHRTPVDSAGKLIFDQYMSMKTRANTLKDTPLPLARIMRAMYDRGHIIMVLTSRHLDPFDYEYLEKHNLKAHYIVGRSRKVKAHSNSPDGVFKASQLNKYLNLKQLKGLPVIMFDDSKEVLATLRKRFPVLNSIKVNERLTHA